MSEAAIKKRLRRAVEAAAEILDYPKGSYGIIMLDGKTFNIEAISRMEIRKIRIVLDEIKKNDEELVKKFPLPGNCTKEIWCRSSEGGFFMKKISD
jgi:hypothetical protein